MQHPLGNMPEAESEIYDIYMAAKDIRPDQMPNRQPYDTNGGKGYSREDADAILDRLNNSLTGMRLQHLTFVKRLRNMPKEEDPPDWPEE